MPLRLDEIQEVQEITRQIVKKEIKTMGKLLEATSKKLEGEIKELEAKSGKLKELAEELGRQIRNLKPEKPKESEKFVSKSFSKK